METAPLPPDMMSAATSYYARCMLLVAGKRNKSLFFLVISFEDLGKTGRERFWQAIFTGRNPTGTAPLRPPLGPLGTNTQK
jgi:hypothetical protein